jgi:hypothetical protein
MSKSIVLILLGFILTFVACDKVAPPNYGCTNPIALNYDPDATLDDGNCEFDPSILKGCTDSTASNYNVLAVIDDCHCRYDSVRTVLLEDYTGFRCSNCPQAAEELKRIECTYGARVVPLAVHVSETFAAPENNAYDIEFGNSLFLPNGLINRNEYDGLFPQLYNSWEGHVANVLAQPPEALLDLDVTYNQGTREATALLKVSALIDMNAAPYRLVVLLSEDSIVDWQSDNRMDPPKLSDYVHMHALRDGFTTAWGDAINSGGSMSAGFTETVSKSLVIDAEYVDHNCNVVAFIFRDDTKEVIQAEYKPVIEE